MATHVTLDTPLNEITVPYYPGYFTITGFERTRNGITGHMLTLAHALHTVPGRLTLPVRDLVTLMRLADVCSQSHDFPVNAARLYGPRGRRAPVGRTTQQEASPHAQP